ncbi:hypothetical protein HPULCUR_002320 [Helicostylum pulchrum]|uniref:Uncharacterized protein n=1 Tax=Helicostylum pulchrum TaxID=562976 RepID=A0ABP9XS88_9FUNG
MKLVETTTRTDSVESFWYSKETERRGEKTLSIINRVAAEREYVYANISKRRLEDLDSLSSTSTPSSSVVPSSTSTSTSTPSSSNKRNIFEIDEIDEATPIVILTASEFRLFVFACGVKALNKSFSMIEGNKLRKMTKHFKPVTLAQHLDMFSANLIMTNELKELKYINALKLSLSHIVDKVNGTTLAILQEHINDKSFWDRVGSNCVVKLANGLTDKAKKIYLDVMNDSLGVENKLDKRGLKLAISKKRTLMLEFDEDDGLDIPDIMDILAKHVIVDSTIAPNSDESEITCYRKFMKILDDIFNGTNLDLVDGEIPCQATKAIAKDQEHLFGNKIPLNKGFGRRIDLIMSAKGCELSSSEWKKNENIIIKVITTTKNIRTNKAILSSILKQPICEEDAASVFVVGMD